MNEQQFKDRTRQPALRVIRLVEALPDSRATYVIGGQMLRSATSVGANYRAACRAKSTADMISKLHTVLEEADETRYWLELIVELNLMAEQRVASLLDETDQIIAMLVASLKTLRAKQR